MSFFSKKLLEEINRTIDFRAYENSKEAMAVSFVIELQTLLAFRREVLGTEDLPVSSPLPTVPNEFSLPVFIQDLPENVKRGIVALYPNKEFLFREAMKMSSWLSVNHHKAPRSVRGWARFVTGWYERGWERFRVTLSSNRVESIDWKEVFR